MLCDVFLFGELEPLSIKFIMTFSLSVCNFACIDRVRTNVSVFFFLFAQKNTNEIIKFHAVSVSEVHFSLFLMIASV